MAFMIAISNSPDFSAANTCDGNEKSVSGWFISPSIDLLFCCGGFLLILMIVGLALPLGASLAASTFDATRAVISMSIAGTVLFGYPHIAATWIELYSDVQLRRSHPLVSYLLPAVIVILIILSALEHWALVIMANVYSLFVIHHFAMQSFGICLFYCQKQASPLNSLQAAALKRLFQTTVIYAITRQFAQIGPASANGFGAGVPLFSVVPDWLSLVALSWVLVSAGGMLLCFRTNRNAMFMPLPAAMLSIVTVGVFLLGPDKLGQGWLLVPAFFHGCQYIVVTSACKLQRTMKSAESMSLGILSMDMIEYLLLLVFLGFVVFGSIRMIGQLLGLDEANANTAAVCAVGLHHFVVDGFMWRGKDSKLKELL